MWGGDVAQLVRASDRRAADAGSISRCGKGFFSHSQLSVHTHTCVRTPPCAIACIDICAHVKDPVVHVKVRWIMETLKHPARTVGWVARLCRSWLSRGRQPEFPMGEICVPSGTSRASTPSPTTILQGTSEGGRRCGRQRILLGGQRY